MNAPCGSTVGYQKTMDDKVEPILGPYLEDPKGRKHRRCVWDGILRFQQDWLRHGKSQAQALQALLGPDTYHDIVCEYAAAILSRFWSYPLKDEAERYGSLYHDANNGIDNVEQICTAENRKRFRKCWFRQMSEWYSMKEPRRYHRR